MAVPASHPPTNSEKYLPSATPLPLPPWGRGLGGGAARRQAQPFQRLLPDASAPNSGQQRFQPPLVPFDAPPFGQEGLRAGDVIGNDDDVQSGGGGGGGAVEAVFDGEALVGPEAESVGGEGVKLGVGFDAGDVVAGGERFEVVVEAVLLEPAGDPGAVAAGGEGEAEAGGLDGVEDGADAGAQVAAFDGVVDVGAEAFVGGVAVLLDVVREAEPGVEGVPGADAALPVLKVEFAVVLAVEGLPVGEFGGFGVEDGAVEVEDHGLDGVHGVSVGGGVGGGGLLSVEACEGGSG